MWNLINLNNFEIVKDFWNGRGDLGMDLDAWAKNTRAAAGRYMLVGNHENNKGFVIVVDVSDVKLDREVKVGNRKIPPDDMFSSCLVVNGVVISTSFDGRMIEMIAELNSEGVEFHSYDRDTREFVQISYVPGGIMKKVKWYRVV